MIAALLPGVRELRTPLVTGLLVMACLWMLVGSRILAAEATQSLLARFDGLPVSTSAGLAALVFSAYLLGSLLIVRTSPFRWIAESPVGGYVASKIHMLNEGKPARRPWLRPVTWLWGKAVVTGSNRLARYLRAWGSPEPGSASLEAWLDNEFSSRWALGRVPVSRGWEGGCQPLTGFESLCDPSKLTDEDGEIYSQLRSAFIWNVESEQSAAEVRIQMGYPDVYLDIDRLKAEAELRFSIFWPLTVLIIMLSFTWSPWTLILLLFPVLLCASGRQRSQEAMEKTWAPVIAGQIATPYLESMQREHTKTEGASLPPLVDRRL